MKYRFVVTYQPKEFKEVCDFLQKCDIDIGEVCIKELWEFTMKNDVPIPKIKETFDNIFTHLEMKLFSMEGGKIE